MLQQALPEQVGVSSQSLLNFINRLEREEIMMHSIILARGDKVFFKAFWNPFNEHSIHRMYSQTKSFVGIAVCELAAEGKIDIKKPIIDYFPDMLPENMDERFKRQTVEDMLTMRTCTTGNNWFVEAKEDRLRYYFSCPAIKEPNTAFDYDSNGSFVLGCLIEQVTGMDLLSYMREHFLDAIGFSKNAHILKTIGDRPWGDSSLLCETGDILLFGRLLADGGKWEDRQILNADWVKRAISYQTSTPKREDEYCQHGYGYQIWINRRGGFFFNGMHGQYMHYDPKTDIIFACTSGNRIDSTGQNIYDALVDEVLESCQDTELSIDNKSASALKDRLAGLTLSAVKGESYSETEEKINGCRFTMKENPMGIRWIKFDFSEKQIKWEYENQQGQKELPLGRKENAFWLFPQEGYSDKVGGAVAPGRRYCCGSSMAWTDKNTLTGLVQIIDEYIGVLDLSFTFEGNKVLMKARKSAENFLSEYDGEAEGEM